MNLLDLFVTIKADDQASSKIASVADNAKSGFGKAAKAAGAAAAAVGAGVTAFGGAAVGVGMQFDSSMSQVAATMGKTSKDLEGEVGTVDLAWGKFSGNMREYAQEMGAHTAFSASEAAEALNYMALAGYDTQKSMGMLPNVLNLAAAGNIDLAEASDMVTDAASALGLNTEDTTKMVDQMAAASANTNTSVAQLGSAFLTVGATARDMKGGTQEMAQVLGLLADNGVKGAEGGTALRNILMSISSEKFEKTFGAMGVSAYDAQGNLRSLKDVFADMNKAMEGMTVEEKTKLISEAFNKFDLNKVNALLGTNAERWDEVSAAIGDSSGAAQKMADTQLDNLQGDLKLLQSALEGFQIAVSDNFTPALREVAQFGGDALSRLTTALKEEGIDGFVKEFGAILKEGIEKAAQELPGMLEAAVTVISAILEGLANALPTLLNGILAVAPDVLNAGVSLFLTLGKSFLEAAPEIASTIGSSLGEIVTSVVPNAVSAVVELANSIVENIILKIPDMLRAGAEMLRGITQGIKDHGSEASGATTDVVTGILDTILAAVPDILEALGEWWTALIEFVATMLPVIIETVVNLIGSLVTTIFEHIPDILAAAAELFAQLLATIAENLPTIIETVVNGILSLLDTLITTVTEHGPDLLAAAGEFIGKIGMAIVENLPKIIMTLVEGLVKLIGTVISKLPDMLAAGAKLIGKLPEAILAAGKSIAEAVGNVVKGAIDSIGGFLEGAAKAGSDLATSIGQGIKDFADDPVGAVQDLASDAVEKAKSFAEGMQEAGGNLVDAIKDGIGDKGDGPISAVQEAVSDAVETAKGFAEDMYEAGSELWGEITDAIADPDKTVADVVGEHISDFANDIGDFVQKMAQAGADLVGGLVNGIANNFWQVGDAITGGLDQAVNDALNFLGIASPSKLFKWIGEMTMKGGEEGLEKNAYRLADAMGDAMDGMYGAVGDGVVDFQIEAHAIEQSIEAMRRLNMERERSLMLLNETAMAQRSAGVDAGIGGASQIVINVNDPIIKEEADVDKIFDYVQTRVRRQASIWAQSPSMA